MSSLPRLKKRHEFVKVAQTGAYMSRSTLVVQSLVHEGSAQELGFRVGFTASKRVGNSVKRNKAKRRMREVVRLWIKETTILPGCDLVIIAKATLITAPFIKVQDDFKKSLIKLQVIECS